ncbi:hypothetical protein N9L47_01600 [Rhodobacteraceae bacterium]|nr:hypothetical protein [Paracoccaceae bacterium]
MRILLVACFLATPLFSQSLDPQYEVVGDFEGMFGETPLVLNSLFDLEKDRSMVRLRDVSGFVVVGISARTIGEDGKPTRPSISFNIGPIGVGSDGARADVTYSDVSGNFVSDIDIGGRVTLLDYEQTETTVSFSLEATLQPIKRSDVGYEIDETRVSQVISGAFSGMISNVD